jgi:predicted DNA binding CopG/RHH family protein
MAKKSSGLSARALRALKNVRHVPDSEIDFSDIPEATDEQLRRARQDRARRLGRPITGNAKQLIAIRIAPRVLAELRRLAAKESKPYQTYIHELLERHANKHVA